MKIGARIIKTGIAVTITVFIANMLNLQPAVFGAVSAVINMQPSVYLTFTTARDLVVVHLLGVLVGVSLGYLLGGNPVTMGIATIAIISMYIGLNIKNGLIMGVVAALFILAAPQEQFLVQSLSRSGVIFTGLLVAMIVNIILWVPRFNERFIDKLRESNLEAVSYFCQAVADFARLDNEEISYRQEQKEKVVRLNGEVRNLLEHFRNEQKHDFGSKFYLGYDDRFNTLEKFMEYTEGLTERANQIYDLMPARLDRRLKCGSPQISHEFYAILDLLEKGCITIQRVNEKLRKLNCDRVSVEPEEISESYWKTLSQSIEKWQPNLTSTFHLHALIEISVVASEIRWIAREGKLLLINSREVLQ